MTTSFDNSILQSVGTLTGGAESGGVYSPTAPQDGIQWASNNVDDGEVGIRHGRSIRPQDIAEITAQLAIMTRSGVDVASALGSLASQCRRPKLSEVLHAVHEAVLSGNTMSDALRQHPQVFEANFVATVAAGEASGHMSDVLETLAQMQRAEIRSRRALRAMLTYPVLLLLVSSSVLFALVLFVLPRFADIFAQYEIPLPAITQFLIAVSHEFWTRWWLWVPVFVGSILSIVVWRKTLQGRRVLDTLWIRLPLIESVYRSRLVGRTCRLLGLMLNSGVPLVESLALTRKTIDNSLFRDLITDLEEAVVNGRSLASALPENSVLPQSAREMLVTAEKTGKLGEVTKLLGVYYDEEAEANMKQLVGVLEPIITVGMGIIVAGVVLAVMLPVFDLSSLAQRGH